VALCCSALSRGNATVRSGCFCFEQGGMDDVLLGLASTAALWTARDASLELQRAH
jgi:hypothetical protein